MTLHAVWKTESLFLWADEPRAPHTEGQVPHRALTHEQLRAAVGELLGDGLLPQAAAEDTLTLFLPHDDRGPLARGDEPTGGIGGGVITHLEPVTLPALRFTPTQAVDLFTPLEKALPSNLPPHLPDSAGESLVFFTQLHRYVLHKIAAKQFYPDLDRPTAGTFKGVWRLLTHDPVEVERLSRFAAALPPVARALEAPADDPGLYEAGRIVESFVATLADAFIRRAVSTDEFFTRVHGLAAAPAAAGDVRFLSALLGEDHILRGGNTDSNALLSELLRPWTGKLDEGRSSEPWRLVFSLREPALPDIFDEDSDATDGGDLEWRLVLQLKAPSDDGTGTLIDAEELWDTAGDPTHTFGRGVAERKAQLTADLTRAAEVLPMLAPLVQSETPSEMNLSTPDANTFIRSGSIGLRSAGFLVELPEWADRRERGLGLLLSVRPDGDDDEEFYRGRPDGAGGAFGPNGFNEIPSGHFGLESLLNFDWQIAVGDLRLSPAEFKALAGRGSPLVRYKGQWLQIDPDAGNKAQTFLAEKGKGKMTLAQALKAAYGIAPTDTGLPVVGLQGRGWLDQLLSTSPTIAVGGTQQPKSFLGTMRPYQLRGLDWMLFLDRLGLGGCLADDMGLGKTPQLISLLLAEREAPPVKPAASSVPVASASAEPLPVPSAQGITLPDTTPHSTLEQSAATALPPEPTAPTPLVLTAAADSTTKPSAPGTGNGSALALSTGTSPTPPPPAPKLGPTLLFAPTSVVGNWIRELGKFAPNLKILLHHGPDRDTGDAFKAKVKDCDVVITSYALAHRDIEDLKSIHWHRVAVDEAQKIKNPSAAATVAIRSIPANRRIALTGTPIENHLSELWSIMELLNPGLLGSAADFRERFAVPVEKMGDKEKAAQLRKMIQPFVLRRTKNDPNIAGDLPEKMEMKVYCNLTAEQAAAYERITGEMLGQIDTATGIRRRGLILAALTRLKQVCDHPILLEQDNASSADVAALDRRSGKCERILEMLEEALQEGDAALVFTQYREMGHLLEKMIQDRLKIQTQFLHGGTTARQRDAMIERFQDPQGGVKVFILSLRAGGLGLNLTAANHVFHFDRWWNPAVEQQATDRAHRIGQTRKVQVHQFVCVGTLEERIDKLLQDKLQLADQVVGSGDEWLTSMSTDQLRQYLSLGQDAVSEF